MILTFPFDLPDLICELSVVPRKETQCCQYCCLSVLLQMGVSPSRGGGVDTGWSGAKCVVGSEAETTLSSWCSDCFTHCLCHI